jgi:hypothetical protein
MGKIIWGTIDKFGSHNCEDFCSYGQTESDGEYVDGFD